MSRKKILLFQKLIPHYRIAIFKELFSVYGIIVCHSIPRKKSTWSNEKISLDFNNIRLPRLFYGRNDQSILQTIMPVLFKERPDIVITESSLSYITFWKLLLLRRIFGYKLLLWTHGVRNKDIFNPFESRSSKIMLWAYNRADAIVLYSEERRKILSNFLGDSKKLFYAPNTIDTKRIQKHLRELANQGRQSIKQKVGFKNQYNLIFIGRLLNNKGLDLMIDCFYAIMDEFDLALHIVGDGPEAYKIRERAESNPNVILHGPIYDEDLTGEMLYAADLFVMLGYVGLSVVHAMSYGCPIITLEPNKEKSLFHSPEAEYIQHGYNGYLMQDSAEAIRNQIKELLKNDSLVKELSENAISTIQKSANLELMIQGFSDAIKYVS